ncbi:MAG TPA: hypothetical protein VFB73_09415 [Chloroflexota bacterium]|nr:hypothetical protein [Chloroflexota bacterium]
MPRARLARAPYRSALEREIRTFERQLATAREFAQRQGLREEGAPP